MRRMCLTIVYLVLVGLPISAAEPEWTSTDAIWKSVPTSPKQEPISLADIATRIRYGFQWMNTHREVRRPAWPTLTPDRMTVYPAAMSVVADKDQRK